LRDAPENESQPCRRITTNAKKVIRLQSLKLLLEYFITESEQNTDKRSELEIMLRFVDGCMTECSKKTTMTTYTDAILRCTPCGKLTNFECDKLWCYCICPCRKRWHLDCFVKKLSADRETNKVLCPAEGCGRETVKRLVVGQYAKLEICSITVFTQESLIVCLNQILRLSDTLPRGHQSGQDMKSVLKRVLETSSLNPPLQLQSQGEEGCDAQPLGGDEAVDTQRQDAKPKGKRKLAASAEKKSPEVVQDSVSYKRPRYDQEFDVGEVDNSTSLEEGEVHPAEINKEALRSSEHATQKLAEDAQRTEPNQAEIDQKGLAKAKLGDATRLEAEILQAEKEKKGLQTELSKLKDAIKKEREDAIRGVTKHRNELEQAEIHKNGLANRLDDAQRKATELATQLDQAGKAKKDLEKALDDAERKATQLETELDQAKKDATKLETQLHQAEINKKGLAELIPRKPLGRSVDFVTKKNQLIQISKQAAADRLPVPLRILKSGVLSKKDLQDIVRVYHGLRLYPGLKIRSRDVKEHTASFIAILHPPLPPAPAPGALPPLPQTGQCAWSFDEGSRILTANFASNPARQKVLPFMEGMRVIEQIDEEFLLKMMERTDITLIVEGLLSRPVEEIARQLLDGLTALGSENVKVGHYQATSSDGVKTWTKIRTMEVAAKEFSAYVQEVSRHPNEGKITLQGAEFDIKTDKFYLIDFDISSHHPQFLEDFSRKLFLFPQMLPGGKHCMTHAVPKPSRSIMLPLMYLGPPSVSTSLHEDGYGTVDSGHLCLQGWNEVCILPRMEVPAVKAAVLEILRATACTKEEPNAENAQTIPWPKKEMIDTLMKEHRYVYVCQQLYPQVTLILANNLSWF
jgi:predicted  nucleic acid-binding Zn-ribbon protein